MGLQDLLQRILFLFGIGFLIANILVVVDLVRFRIRKPSALLVCHLFLRDWHQAIGDAQTAEPD